MKTIVIARQLSDIVIVTPSTRANGRGIVADEVLITDSMLLDARTPELLTAVLPCFDTQPTQAAYVRSIRELFTDTRSDPHEGEQFDHGGWEDY